jgi:hypothetical protein
MKTAALARHTKVADEVWIVAALLHREHPKREDFSIEEIMDRAAKEAGKESLRPGVYVHVVQHCVANRPPNPGRYRSLLDWYRDWSRDSSSDRIKNDPLLALRGSGKHIWADEHADEYIRRLREGWE